MRAACVARVREARAALQNRSRPAVRQVLEEIIDDEQQGRQAVSGAVGGTVGCGGGAFGGAVGCGGGAVGGAAGGGGEDAAMHGENAGAARGEGGFAEWDEALEDALSADERAELLVHLEAVLLEEELLQHAELRDAEEDAELRYLVGLCER